MAELLMLLLALFLSAADTSYSAELLAYVCGDTNYTQNSTFQSNLDSFLSSLPAADVLSTGFVKNSSGDLPDRVNGVILCRGDVTSESCRRCGRIAVQDIVQQCPYKKSALVWYDDCMLRYSNLLTIPVTGEYDRILYNAQNLTEVNQFQRQLRSLMSTLAQYAAYNSTAEMFATGVAEYGDKLNPKIYGLVQCTRDISAADCDSCLGGAITYLRGNYPWSRGARYLKATCNVRYELYSFYNTSGSISIPMFENTTPPMASEASPPEGNNYYYTSNSNNKTKTVLAIVLPIGAAVLLIGSVCVYWSWRKAGRRNRNEKNSEDICTIESLLFPLSTILAATNNFSDVNKLGEGGFGSVYKGLLPDGTSVAVKRLSSFSAQGVEQLKNEVVLLAQLQHRNLVRLLGVCLEEEKLLVYEFVANRSLDTVLFDYTRSQELNWATRLKMIEGIARGLQYLHEDSQVKIIHRDLKANNVLIDADMNAKISDFGLARLVDVDQTQASTTRIVGTYGYMAPEYAMKGNFSSKSDVFSFGVLVLEIITGQRNSSFSYSGSSEDLLSCVWERWAEGTVLEVVDPVLCGKYQKNEVLRCIQLALLCLQDDPASRPSMSSIVLRLSSYSISMEVPLRPGFLIGYKRSSSSRDNEQSPNSSNSIANDEFPAHGGFMPSPADMSISGVEPR